jgi:hypothetical protein
MFFIVRSPDDCAVLDNVPDHETPESVVLKLTNIQAGWVRDKILSGEITQVAELILLTRDAVYSDAWADGHNDIV